MCPCLSCSPAEVLRLKLQPLAVELDAPMSDVVDLLAAQPVLWAINTPSIIKDRWARRAPPFKGPSGSWAVTERASWSKRGANFWVKARISDVVCALAAQPVLWANIPSIIKDR